MDYTNWKIDVHPRLASLQTEIYIWRHRGDVIEFFEKIEHGDVMIKTIPQNEGSAAVKPLMILRDDTAADVVRAFISYGNEKGIKNNSETFAIGKLEATEKHLEDMRTLVFKEK